MTGPNKREQYDSPNLTEYGSIESVTETWGDWEIKKGGGEDTDWCLAILDDDGSF